MNESSHVFLLGLICASAGSIGVLMYFMFSKRRQLTRGMLVPFAVFLVGLVIMVVYGLSSQHR